MTRSYFQDSNSDKRRQGSQRTKSALLGAVALAVLGGATSGGVLPAFAQAPQTAPTGQSALPSFADVVDRVKPAVVSVRARISGEEVAQSSAEDRGSSRGIPGFDIPEDYPFQEFFKQFRGEENPSQSGPRAGRPEAQRGVAQGSGFFVSADGYLVTNNHVIEKSSDVEVLMDDGRTLSAKIVGTDPKTDLALLKVEEGGPFKYVAFSPEAPRVGDWVLAVGNPFGLGGTVTAGIVSARARDIGAGPYDDFLQIDAPVNRGNSGGPTFNQRGQVVGVNTAIASPSGGSVGIAFAIPSETVQAVVTQLREKGSVERGFIGVQIQPVTKDIAASLGLEETQGAIVAHVESNSPAAKAGVKTGDIVLSVNNKTVSDARDLSKLVASLSIGSTADFQISRDGKKQNVTVTIGKMTNSASAAADAKHDTALDQLGLKLAPADSAAGGSDQGVAVVGVEPDSPAAEKGMTSGDVIKEIAGRPVESLSDVRDALEAGRKDGKKSVLFLIENKRGTRFVALQVPAA